MGEEENKGDATSNIRRRRKRRMMQQQDNNDDEERFSAECYTLVGTSRGTNSECTI
jgi:hypothetical protein